MAGLYCSDQVNRALAGRLGDGTLNQTIEKIQIDICKTADFERLFGFRTETGVQGAKVTQDIQQKTCGIGSHSIRETRHRAVLN